MAEGGSGSSGSWAAGGMTMFPGFNPRPEHRIVDQKNITENVNSTSKALFVHAKGCDEVELNIVGKIGKLTLENCSKIKVDVSENIVGGMLEVIKCQNICIRCRADAVVPIVQVDDSSDVKVYIQKKEQIECVIFIRSKSIKLLLENQKVGEEEGLTLQYEVSLETDEIEDVQRAGHWTAASVDADFVTGRFVRTSKYPTVAQMKDAISGTKT